MNAEPKSGYYAPIRTAYVFDVGAWTIFVGRTPDGAWVVEYHSAASSRYQRTYHETKAAAVAEAENFGVVR